MAPKQEILKSEVILQKYGHSLAGKTILVTGVSSDSIAGELALQLSSVDPALLILVARAESKVTPIVEKIRARHPNVATRFLQMDLGDLASIRAAVDSLSDLPKIDHFISVAGVMVPPYGTTKDGFETQFGVNYLANFLLVKLLLPKIQAAGPSSSIIIVASSAVRSGQVNFDDVGYKKGETYDPLVAYGQSNAARVMFAKALAEKLEGQKIRVYSIDPGAVQSGLQRHFTPELTDTVTSLANAGQMRDLDGKPYSLPPWTTRSEGAATMITGMIDPSITDSNGAFLHNNAVAEEELHSHIRNRDNWTRLWELSEELIGEKFSL
ncbi:hypothetical protein Asppvi_003873 [Aspergillus pseudoviridinutans]|uniref:Short-chain dehydrogenase n=1 Tax=Aspergillus pseudoviridinutans TaxID=1517512 RepID=A0A9P3B987_9EURO|nr:uncharacterized protein Asppvi_003873 [Aspergillus pseudoviridinutans]GIJ85018.1 hypothetical protein Asppvi_003873 [Aspergillus pseudoviridinutans]